MTEDNTLTSDDKKLKNIVQSVLRERFDDVVIDSINIAHDKDEDGDDILRVQVIFDGKQRQLDARKASTVLRHMIPKMMAIGVYSFPIISFIAKSDIRKAKAATA